MKLQDLEALLISGGYHHATYRNCDGRLLEGLWIYRSVEDGCRGFTPAGAFFHDDPNLDAAYALVRATGVSVGSYGNG